MCDYIIFSAGQDAIMSPMTIKTKALLAIIIAACLWASASSVAKVLVAQTNPFVVTFYRFGIASVILLPLFVIAKKPKGYLLQLLPLGLFNTGNVLFYYTGAALTTANTMVILGTAVPITVTACSYLLIHESPSRQKLIGIVLGLIGVLYIVLLPIIVHGQAIGGTLAGNLLEVGSLLSWTMYIIYSRHILSKGTFSPIVSTSINLFTCTVGSAIAALVTHQSFLVPAFRTPTYLGTMIYAAIGITVITFFLFQWAIQHVSASTASLKEYLQLVVGVGINGVVLGEAFTVNYILGSALVVIGVIIATSGQITKKLSAILFSQGE